MSSTSQLTYKVNTRIKRQKLSSSSSSSSSSSDSSSSDSQSDSEPEALQQQKEDDKFQQYFQLGTQIMNLTSTVQILFDAEMTRRLAKIVAYYFPHVKTLDYTHRVFTHLDNQAATKVEGHERMLDIPIFSYAYCPTMQGWRQEIDKCPNKHSQDRMNCFIIADTSVKVLSDNALYDKLRKLENCLIFLDHYYNTSGAVHSAYLLQGRASTLSTTDYTGLLQKGTTVHPVVRHRPLTHLLDLYSKGRFFVFVD